MSFSPGQYVTCIDNRGYESRLTLSKIYLITRTSKRFGPDEFSYTVDDNGHVLEVFSRRFSLIVEEDI